MYDAEQIFQTGHGVCGSIHMNMYSAAGIGDCLGSSYLSDNRLNGFNIFIDTDGGYKFDPVLVTGNSSAFSLSTNGAVSQDFPFSTGFIDGVFVIRAANMLSRYPKMRCYNRSSLRPGDTSKLNFNPETLIPQVHFRNLHTAFYFFSGTVCMLTLLCFLFQMQSDVCVDFFVLLVPSSEQNKSHVWNYEQREQGE